MKKLRKVLWSVLGLLLLFLFAVFIFVNTLTPSYEGYKEINGLSEKVTVYFDPYGIPHIYANTEEDAYRSLGYVHAQDRLWQMELMRRIAKGELSEVFGKDLVDTDKFMLSLGIDEHTKKTVGQLDINSEMVRLAQAYLDGINQFLEEGPTPIEFYLTGIDKRPFTLEDVYNTVGYMAFTFAQAHKTDPLLTHIKDKLGPEYLKNLPIDTNTATEIIKNYDRDKDSVSSQLSGIAYNALEKLPVPLFEGSNSWVLAPEKTKNGKVIFANDPHIGFAQPSVWYEAHLVTPTYEKYGYHLAGVPFPLLGHDRKIAYGLTMFQNDDLDFYYETNNPENPNQYKTESGWQDYKTVTKTIRVKDEADIEFTYKVSRHGPV